jgi:hypothetical protein
MENQLLSRNLGASDSYSSYFVEAIGGNASNSGGASFYLPDDKEENSSTDENPEKNLAQQYDLGKHLDGDRTIFSKNPEKISNPVEIEAPTDPFSRADDELTAGTSPFLVGDARALRPQAEMAQRGVSPAEKFSTRSEADDRTLRHAKVSFAERVLYSTDIKQVESFDDARGTSRALLDEVMVCARDNSIFGTLRSSDGATAFSQDADTGSRNDRRSSQEHQMRNFVDAEINAGAAAVAAYEASSDNKTVPGKTPTLPRFKEISQAILDEIERMRTNPDRNSVDLTLDLSDGSTLGMKLRWRGGDMSVTFGDDADTMRGEIENGWASLVLNTGNSGVRLDAPRFGADETIFTETSHYA